MPDRQLLLEIVESQLEMVCRFRCDGTIIFANRTYAENIGEAGHDLAGRNLWDFITGEDRAHVEAQLTLLNARNVSLTIENRVETAAGTRWMLWRNHALEFDADGRWTVAQSTGIDITERKLLEERLMLMVDELNHRVRNTLMVVQSLAEQSLLESGCPVEPVERFNERLLALAEAHTILSRGNWSGATLQDVVRHGLFMLGHDARVTLEGSEVMISARQTVPLIMVLHELATNALKYGALSQASGRLSVAWQALESGDVVIDWVESGGPEVVPPTRTGFGSQMVKNMIGHQLRGKFDADYRSDGLRCRIAFANGTSA